MQLKSAHALKRTRRYHDCNSSFQSLHQLSSPSEGTCLPANTAVKAKCSLELSFVMIIVTRLGKLMSKN
jgi:hypothetical protein